jgi:hypothetical protein
VYIASSSDASNAMRCINTLLRMKNLVPKNHPVCRVVAANKRYKAEQYTASVTSLQVHTAALVNVKIVVSSIYILYTCEG